MKTNLYQHKLFEQRWITLIENGLSVRSKSFFKVFEYEIKFENIGTKIINIKKGRNRLLIWGGILVGLAMVLFFDKSSGGNVENGADIFYLIPGIILLTFYWITFENSKYIVQAENSNGIKFLSNKPSEAELNLFFQELFLKRKDYLLKKYGQLNKNLSYEMQYQNLVWLKDNHVLTADEYKLKQEQLDAMILPTTVVTGFNLGRN